MKEAFIDEVFASLPEQFANKAKIQFCGPTGGDAIEAALKLVKTATGNLNDFIFSRGISRLHARNVKHQRYNESQKAYSCASARYPFSTLSI